MAEDTPQEEKTEDPTSRRIEKAREDGQVLRSQDMTIAVVTIGFIASLYSLGFYVIRQSFLQFYLHRGVLHGVNPIHSLVLLCLVLCMVIMTMLD